MNSQALHLSSEQALATGHQLKGKHVIVTGASSGFGRGFAMTAASFGAKVVISDLNVKGVQAVGDTMKSYGWRVSVYPKSCNTSDWATQVDMFDFARDSFGEIDVVVPNAGVGEMSKFMLTDELDDAGRLKKDPMVTMQVNLIGAIYTTRLGFHHLKRNPAKEGKAIVMLGSIYSANELSKGVMYATAKHAIYGFFKSIYWDCEAENIRLNIMAPWFVATGIISPMNAAALFGLPYAEVSDVVAAMIQCAADPTFSGNHVVVDVEGILAFPFTSRALGEGGYYDESHKRSASTTSLAHKLKDGKSMIFALLRYWMPKSSLGQILLVLAVLSISRKRLIYGKAP